MTLFPPVVQFLTGYDTDETVKHLVDTFDWYILPIVNPDGYEFTHTDVSNHYYHNDMHDSCVVMHCPITAPPHFHVDKIINVVHVSDLNKYQTCIKLQKGA